MLWPPRGAAGSWRWMNECPNSQGTPIAADDQGSPRTQEGRARHSAGGGQPCCCGCPALFAHCCPDPSCQCCKPTLAPGPPLCVFIMCYILCCRLASMWLLLSAVEEEKRSGVVVLCLGGVQALLIHRG
jgi:hypothetical protein